MVGQAQVVVRAQQQHRPSVEQDARALRTRDTAQLAVEPTVADVLQPLLDLCGHAASGLTWTTSGNAFGAPSGRGGTEVFLRWRSWTAGFQKLASSRESIRSSTGVRGVS